MSSSEWLQKNFNSKWSKTEFNQFVGIDTGKWNGVIERIMVGNQGELKVKTLQIIKNNIESVDEEKLALMLYNFVIGAVLDHCDDVVKEAVILYKSMLKYQIFRRVTSDTIRLILIEIVITEWKELRIHCYDVFSLDSLSDTLVLSLMNQLTTIYPRIDQNEKEYLLKTIILSSQHCVGSFICLNSIWQTIPIKHFIGLKDVFISLFLMNYSSALAKQFVDLELMNELNLISPLLCPLDLANRSILNLPPSTAIISYVDPLKFAPQ